MTPLAQRNAPCIPGDLVGSCCLAGLLLGVACCRKGDCALCERERDRMRRIGFTKEEVARRFARSRKRLLSRCPACGFPPPAPLNEVPPLPRLDRSHQLLGGTPTCRSCGAVLLNPRRRYCNQTCWNTYLADSRRERKAQADTPGVARA